MTHKQDGDKVSPTDEEIVKEFAHKYAFTRPSSLIQAEEKEEDVIKDLTNLLSQVRTQERARIIEEVEKLNKYNEKFQDEISADFYHRTGYNKALTDIINIIKNNGDDVICDNCNERI